MFLVVGQELEGGRRHQLRGHLQTSRSSGVGGVSSSRVVVVVIVVVVIIIVVAVVSIYTYLTTVFSAVIHSL